jgi:hypothetical protein
LVDFDRRSAVDVELTSCLDRFAPGTDGRARRRADITRALGLAGPPRSRDVCGRGLAVATSRSILKYRFASGRPWIARSARCSRRSLVTSSTVSIPAASPAVRWTGASKSTMAVVEPAPLTSRMTPSRSTLPPFRTVSRQSQYHYTHPPAACTHAALRGRKDSWY